MNGAVREPPGNRRSYRDRACPESLGLGNRAQYARADRVKA